MEHGLHCTLPGAEQSALKIVATRKLSKEGPDNYQTKIMQPWVYKNEVTYFQLLILILFCW